MMFDTESVLAVIDNEPKTVRDIVGLIYSPKDYGDKATKITHTYKMLRQLVKDGKVKSAVIDSEGNRKVKVFYQGDPVLEPRLSDLDRRLLSILKTRTYTRSDVINREIYGDDRTDNTSQNIRNHLYFLESKGLVERRAGPRYLMWRLKE